MHWALHMKVKAVTKPFQGQISRPSQAGRMAGPFQIERAQCSYWFRCQTFYVLNSRYSRSKNRHLNQALVIINYLLTSAKLLLKISLCASQAPF